MFTGIISDVTEVMGSRASGQGQTLTFKKPKGWDDLILGESVNTNGVCLTVSELSSVEYQCHLMPETLDKSTFGKDTPDQVNLERALKVNDRLGGHFVQGHVDDTGTVVKIEKNRDWGILIRFSPAYRNLVVYKGSITVNGVSLTVTEVKGVVLGAALVPHTLQHTTLGSLETGHSVNLEFDILGKYIAANLEEMSNAKSRTS